MKFEYAITVRSQRGKDADYGRALERVAFFPGVTEANPIGDDGNSITIGYNGRQSYEVIRQFCSELEADGLMADCALWHGGRWFGGLAASNAMALYCPQTWRDHFQSKRVHRCGLRPRASSASGKIEPRDTL
jgi:hypothetical protein